MLFQHQKRKGSVYILFNDQSSKFRFRAARFVQDSGYVPVYSTIMGDFFGIRQCPRKAKDSVVDMIRKCDHLWVFGKPNATMHDHINYAKSLGKGVKHFRVAPNEFIETS